MFVWSIVLGIFFLTGFSAGYINAKIQSLLWVVLLGWVIIAMVSLLWGRVIVVAFGQQGMGDIRFFLPVLTGWLGWGVGFLLCRWPIVADKPTLKE
jgi:hypothetical protein